MLLSCYARSSSRNRKVWVGEEQEEEEVEEEEEVVAADGANCAGEQSLDKKPY
jgi:hypothetical protein